jgi:uncharacterized membrane protein YraQ (UPF0718 family)
MAVLAIVFAVVVYLVGGKAMTLEGLKLGGQLLWDILPLLIFAFILAGLIQVMIPKEVISRWVGRESGWTGIIIGSVAGGLTPGGPYVVFPIAAALYKTGASIGALVAYIAGWSLWGLSRLPIEVGLLGVKVTIARLVATLIFPPLAGFLAQLFFSKWV